MCYCVKFYIIIFILCMCFPTSISIFSLEEVVSSIDDLDNDFNTKFQTMLSLRNRVIACYFEIKDLSLTLFANRSHTKLSLKKIAMLCLL